jgi:hypothetical protein
MVPGGSSEMATQPMDVRASTNVALLSESNQLI